MILPINIPPIVQTTSDYGDLFSVIGNNTTWKDWLMEHYTNLVYTYSDALGHQFNFWSPIFNTCQLVEYDKHIGRYDFNSFGVDLVGEYLKTLINEKFYIIAEVNQWFIKNTPFYKKHPYVHRVLIYGYDDNLGDFLILGYNTNRKYSNLSLPYEFIKNATIEFEKKLTAPIHTVRLQKIEYQYHISTVMKQFKFYLYGTFESDVSKGAYYFGLQAMMKFHEIIDSWGETSHIDTRLISILYEHKKIQTYKFNRLFEDGHIKDNALCLYCKNIEELAHQAVLITLKMEYAGIRDTLKERLHTTLDEIIEYEYKIYSQAIKDCEVGSLISTINSNVSK